MPRKYVPKPPSEHKTPKRGPKPETIELARRCEELMAQGVERSVLWERLHVTRKVIDHALRVTRQHETQVAGEEPAVAEVKPRRAHRAVHQRPSEAGAPASWKWQDDAACYGEPLELFFGPEGERAAERHKREQEAQAMCESCPVKTDCLDYAMSRPEKAGTWGGLNEDDRAHERRRRMRAASEERRQQEDAA